MDGVRPAAESVGTERAPGQLGGRVAIVTGGSVGIGLAAARALARYGAAVVVVGRTADHVGEGMRAVEREATGLPPMGLVLDVTREVDMQEMASKTLSRYGRIDILITSAGILRASGSGLRTVGQMSLPEWREVLDINLTGTFLSNRAVLPVMIRQGSGQIVNVSSTSGRKGLAYDSAYCASKFGVIGMSQALVEELRPYGVRVHVVLPGAVETEMWTQNGPIPRPGDVLPAERVAELIVHLLLLPADSEWVETVIEPFRVHDRPAWLRSVGAQV